MIATLRKLMIKRVKGQSLVETAIFMPILIILIAGVVEVSNLLVTQNRVSTAARAATGYGASTFSDEEWVYTSTWSTAMAATAINNVTETLDLDPDLWDFWAIHARVNDAGDAFSEWTAVHPDEYGNYQVIAELEPAIQSEILDELQATADSAPINNLEIAATVAYHDRRSLLGLNALNFGPLTRVRGLTVMRVDLKPPFTGCPILPISVRFDQYSAYPSDWPPGLKYVKNPDGTFKYPGDPVTIFPSGKVANGGFEYPDPAPIYVNDATAPDLSTSTFSNNTPGIPLSAMTGDVLGQQRGTIFVAREQGPGGGFGWLSWTGNPSAQELRENLAAPTNFTEKYGGSDADMGTTGDPPYEETGDKDGTLEFGEGENHDGAEWLENSTGNIHAAESEIQYYVDNDVPATLVVYDKTNLLNGENANYRAIGLVKVNILGYSFQGTNAEKWIMFEFLSWGAECE